jgi:lipopolysaccharide export system protein LptA
MPLPVYYLRRWLAVIALLFIATIAGMYFYARHRERNVLKEIPNKLGIEIKQTAAGFEFSKSDGKRTQFKLQAGRVKQFKLDGSAELHNVSIILYGSDSSRFDQIYGDDFSYDKKSGDVTAHGETQIDLEANPAGLTGPDQSPPKELKNPIHLKTRDLVFNQNSGDAFTNSRVDFRTAQASGWAVGVRYLANNATLELMSQVHININGPNHAVVYATNGVITREPRVIVLDHPRLERAAGSVRADEATFFLRPDNTVERVLAKGNVFAESVDQNSEPLHARADEGEMLLSERRNLLRTATLTGNVHVERRGLQPMEADAGRAVFDFLGQNQLQKIHAMDGVRLAQHAAQTTFENPNKTAADSAPQDLDITAPVIDFFIAEGRRIDYAVTSGAAQIMISPAQTENAKSNTAEQRTVITAGRFEAKFKENPDGSSRLTSAHGAPDAKIVDINPGIPARVSTSQTLDASFLPQGGISSIVQQGSVAYTDNQPAEKRTQAWSEQATYTPADRMLVLAGNPRVSDGSMVTTATTIRINRNTDDAFANGDVKSTYNEVKEQPNGALLASSSPIHVTSANMVAHHSSAIATYTGNARLWQDANIIEAPSIQFDRDRRRLVAEGTLEQLVSTVVVQGKQDGQSTAPMQTKASNLSSTKKGKASAKSEENPGDSPIAITSARLTYTDVDRKAHYEGSVTAKGSNFTASSDTMDVYLLPRSQTSNTQQLAGPGRLDRMIAQGNVHIIQPDRRAQGQQVVYTASDDKFVLTGGPPSIFDAERGKITGVSLTFFRADDRVLVEGEASTPVITQTREAR